MNSKNWVDRYKRENDFLIIEVGVKNSRQLFNERDPAPFRERDLDPQFVTYLVSSVEEFSLKTKMKIRIRTADHEDLRNEKTLAIRDAVRSYFLYESILTQAKLQKRLRTARFYFLIGLIALIICLSLAQLIDTITIAPKITKIASVGFIIIGWVQCGIQSKLFFMTGAP